jgi:PQQ enzyme-like repeat protein
VVASDSVARTLRRARARVIIRVRRARNAGRAGRRRFTWARRAVLAATLLAVALVPYPVIGSASIPSATSCRTHCRPAGSAGKILWTRKLPGAWTASAGLNGTVPVSGQAYVAVGHGLAVVGVGMSLRAYSSGTGRLQWDDELPGFPAGSAIVSVRVWPGVVTAGVSYGPGGASRAEVVFSSTTGKQYHWYSATRFGGAVWATTQTTVVVGPGAVTAFDNSTGKPRWRRPTGSADQSWQVDGSDLYVTVAAGGYLGSQPVTALRRIDLATGVENVVRPAAAAFHGTLSGLVDNVVLFSSNTGVTAYDGLTGLWLWSLRGAVPESTDPSQGRFYLTQGTSLLEVDPTSGQVLARASGSAVAGSAGLFAVRNGVALGLDQGANGEAWGYDVSTQQVVWTASRVPWPHYFVDLGGLGGSAEPDGAKVIVAACGKLGPKPSPSASGSAGPSASGSTGSTTSTNPRSSPSSTSGTASGTPSASGPAQATPRATPQVTPAPSGRLCQDPELVAIYR